MDDLKDRLKWLADWVYLYTVVDGLDTGNHILVKEHLIQKWSDPKYVLSDEEERLLGIILENSPSARARHGLGPLDLT
jgi:hypothetical protein